MIVTLHSGAIVTLKALAEPTTTDVGGRTVLGDMRAWTSLRGEAMDASLKAGSLLKLLGMTLEARIGVLGVISEGDYTIVIQEWRPGGKLRHR